MSQEPIHPEDPCCDKKNTLVISIAPCKKCRPKFGEIDRQQYDVDIDVPKDQNDDLEQNPRNMEIEVKIVGLDDSLYESTCSSVASVETKEPSAAKEASPEKLSKNSIKPEPSVLSYHSSEKIITKVDPLKKPISKMSCFNCKNLKNYDECPGPRVCRHSHFYGDNCRLRDPNQIGRKILELHKNGTIPKYGVVSERKLYPQFVLDAVKEIQKIDQTKHDQKYKAPKKISEEKLDVRIIQPNDSIEKIKESEKKNDKERSKLNLQPPVKKIDAIVSVKSVEEELLQRRSSGCYC